MAEIIRREALASLVKSRAIVYPKFYTLNATFYILHSTF